MGDVEQRELTEQVGKALVVFAELLANPKEITARLVQAWTLTLAAADVGTADIERGVARVLATQTFFPTPADFLKALRPPEDADAAAELGWQRTLQAVRQFGRYASLTVADLEGDGTALWAIGRMGWEDLCDELTAENRAIKRAEFVRVYRLGAANGARLEYLIGAQERLNDANGYIRTRALCGRPDWPELPTRTEEMPALPVGTPELPAVAGLGGILASVGREMPEVPEEVLPDNPRLRQRVLEKARQR